MEVFDTLTAVAAPLPLANVDTDKILAGQFLKTITREGLGAKLFHTLRYSEEGRARPDFILNRSPWRDAGILIALENFGCGSSREHAPWALRDFGIRCIIAPSFADIFYNNCFKNAILPIVLSAGEVRRLLTLAGNPASATMTIDLVSQRVRLIDGSEISFDLAAERKQALLEGVDEIGSSLKRLPEIEGWEVRSAGTVPAIRADARLLD
ncbi:3-isopropylmalate dehydratase small subunit [Sphingobium sp. HWE2-09]|uniref:3-isopropylmalate dehydratase small subunit n=1 Tax=Sphingobium sp. HWE2-09 TaxID=3108390 RepID=UPI002DC8D198|nr:3-isopropylmalate dehydratase small subunit [Sphingobium sp. HWE2-09]